MLQVARLAKASAGTPVAGAVQLDRPAADGSFCEEGGYHPIAPLKGAIVLVISRP